MNRWIKAIALALTAALLISLCGFSGECADIRQRVVRLHVLANSDSETDQALKLKVRDAVVEAAAGLFDGAEDADQALNLAREKLPELEEVARQTVKAEGYDYPVKAKLVNMYFTTRSYEDSVTLPAGMYNALRITIGEAEGKNWWCVVFPPICVSAASGHKDLSDVLDQEQEEIVTEPQKYEVRLKIVEIIESISHTLQGWFGGETETELSSIPAESTDSQEAA